MSISAGSIQENLCQKIGGQIAPGIQKALPQAGVTLILIATRPLTLSLTLNQAEAGIRHKLDAALKNVTEHIPYSKNVKIAALKWLFGDTG